jgi:hypothetical protein
LSTLEDRGLNPSAGKKGTNQLFFEVFELCSARQFTHL